MPRKRAKLGQAARQRRSELGALLDAMMQEAHDDAMREATGEPQRHRLGHVTALRPQKKIGIYSAGCTLCRKAAAMIRRIAGADNDVAVLDMHQADVARQAARRGISSVPAVVVDGHLTDCFTGDPSVDEAVLRSAIAA